MEKKIAFKGILLIFGVAVTLIFTAIWYEDYSEQKLKDNIHSEMWDICKEDNMRLTNVPVEYRDSRADFNNEACFMLDYFVYNENQYDYYFSVISENLVDTSQVLMELECYDDESRIARVYRIKDTPEDYMLVAEIEGVYYQYSTYVVEHDSLEEFISIRGGREKLSIEYIEIVLVENEDEPIRYIYGEEASEWAWDLLLGEKHELVGWIPCTCTSGDEYTAYPDKNVQVNIYIRNKAANAVYKAYILPNGNMGICDGAVSFQETEYMFSASEILKAFQTLVDTYEAYKVE